MGAGRGRREDRISKLGDGVLSRVLSFLPAKEAARAAALSSRWRGSFAGVHAVSLEETERPTPDYDDYCSSHSYCGCNRCRDRDQTPPFANTVTAALLARHRRPLRALRVALRSYRLEDSSAVDQWVSYALKHAAPEPAGLELDLCLRRVPVCDRVYALRARAVGSLKLQGHRHPPADVVSPDKPRLRSPAGSVPDGGEEHARRGRKRRRSTSSSSTSSSDSDSHEQEANRRARPRRRRRRSRTRSRSMPSSSSSYTASSSDSDSEEQKANRRARLRRTRRRGMSSSSSSSSTDSTYESDSSSASNSGSRSRSLSDDTESKSDDDDSNRNRRRRRRASSSSSPIRRANRSPAPRPRSPSPSAGEDEDVVSEADDDDRPRPPSPEPPWELPPPREYTVPGRLFSCAVLRSLRIGPCRLSPPAAISLPALEELLLIRVSDEEVDVQRLIAACPRLADLTLEACGTVTALYLVGNRRLRRLALRCCHNLATVTVDDTLHSLEYRGPVANTTLIALPGGGLPRFTSCKVDICGEEVSSVEELTKLGEFLHQLASTKHLHLQSARLGSGVDHDALTTLPAFTRLLHLELMGQLPHDEDGAAAIAAVSRMLQHSPSLEVLSQVFTTGPVDKSGSRFSCDEEKFLDAHQVRYNEYEVLAAPAVVFPCPRNRVREINLVHYHGGRSQRALAKFLLCNAPVLDKLYCGFALGPLWIQTKLIDEIHGWAMNKPENRIFN